MLQGRPLISRRSLSSLLALLLLLSPPLALSAPKPDPVLSNYSVSSTITGAALDSTGRFASVVVSVSALPPLPGSGPFDVYGFDLSRPQDAVIKGTHPLVNRTSFNPNQIVRSSAPSPRGDSVFFIVAGPSRGDSTQLSLWSTSQGSTPVFEGSLQASQVPGLTSVNDVAVSPDGNTLYVAASTGSEAGNGAVLALRRTGSSSFSFLWRYNLTTAGMAATRLVLSADGSTLVSAGQGFLFVVKDPSTCTTKPGTQDLDTLDFCKNRVHLDTSIVGRATSVDVSRDGSRIVLGTSTTTGQGYAYYLDARDFRSPNWPKYSDSYEFPVNSVAIAYNGTGFVVGSGLGGNRGLAGTYEIVDRSGILVRPFPRHTFPDPVTSVGISGNSEYAVAGSGNSLLGFAINRSNVSPRIWSLDLGSPATFVGIGRDGRNIFAAGGTKVFSFRQTFSASLSIVGGPGASLKVADPFERVTFLVNVTNEGSTVDNYTLLVRRPASWFGDSVPSFDLLPGSGRNVPIVVQSPPGTPPGTYTTRVSVFSQTLQREVGRPLFLNVTIQRVYNITLQSNVKETRLSQGEEGQLAFTVTSRGNSVAIVNFTSTQNPSRGPYWRITFPDPQLTLRPGETKSASIVYTAPIDAQNGDRNEVTIVASVGAGVVVGRLPFVVRVNPTFGVSIEADKTTVPDDPSLRIAPNAIVSFRMRVLNSGNTQDLVNLTAQILPQSLANEWNVTLDRTSLLLDSGRSELVAVVLKSLSRTPTAGATLVVRAISQGDPGKTSTKSLTLEVVSPPSSGGTLLPIPGPSPGIVGLALLGALVAARPRRGGGRGS